MTLNPALHILHMKRPALLSTLLLAVFSLSSPAADRPNILWITSEDNSISWVSCYGSKNAKTPNIDRLANCLLYTSPSPRD